jgi:hypothetical protein
MPVAACRFARLRQDIVRRSEDMHMAVACAGWNDELRLAVRRCEVRAHAVGEHRPAGGIDMRVVCAHRICGRLLTYRRLRCARGSIASSHA